MHLITAAQLGSPLGMLERPGPGRSGAVVPGNHDQIQHRILVVDDDDQMGRMIARILARDEFEIEIVNSFQAAVDTAAESVFALAVCDVHLAGHSGIELACQLNAMQPHIGLLMVSGDDDPAVAAAAAKRGGAFGYLVKPFTANELRINVANTLSRRRLELDAAAYQGLLEKTVEQRTGELREAIHELVASREATIRHLSKAVEMRDPNTHAHIDRIGEITAVVARSLGYPEPRAELLRVAATMHDVGKIGIPDRILLKPGQLTPEERAEMERHTTIGYEILSGSEAPLLNLAASIALTHHERIDGTGYPHGLHGEEIPLAGRIVAVADVFDALVNDRVYRPALPLEEAKQVMVAGRGTQFDPTVLDKLFAHLDEILRIETSGAPEQARGQSAASPFS